MSVNRTTGSMCCLLDGVCCDVLGWVQSFVFLFCLVLLALSYFILCCVMSSCLSSLVQSFVLWWVVLSCIVIGSTERRYLIDPYRIHFLYSLFHLEIACSCACWYRSSINEEAGACATYPVGRSRVWGKLTNFYQWQSHFISISTEPFSLLLSLLRLCGIRLWGRAQVAANCALRRASNIMLSLHRADTALFSFCFHLLMCTFCARGKPSSGWMV